MKRKHTKGAALLVFVFIVKMTRTLSSVVCVLLPHLANARKSSERGTQMRNFDSDLGNISCDHPSKLKSSYE